MKHVAICSVLLTGLCVALLLDLGSRVHSQNERAGSNNVNSPQSNQPVNSNGNSPVNAVPTRTSDPAEESAKESQREFVGVENGNVWFNDRSVRKFLTGEGSDALAFLSLNHKKIVFVRTLKSSAGSQEKLRILFTVDSDGRNLTKLAEGKAFWDPQFSPDGRTVYFRSPQWATSNEIRAINIATKRVRAVCPGNTLEVIQKGRYVGKLIVQLPKYFLGRGTYDFYWLLHPDGREIDAIGDSEQSLRSFRFLYF